MLGCRVPSLVSKATTDDQPSFVAASYAAHTSGRSCPAHRSLLWTSRVWPGAVLVDGENVGTWRRSKAEVTIQPWLDLTPRQRRAVDEEAQTLPLPDIDTPIAVTWADPAG